jgi:ferritin-like metal-binding protein YciE
MNLSWWGFSPPKYAVHLIAGLGPKEEAREDWGGYCHNYSEILSLTNQIALWRENVGRVKRLYVDELKDLYSAETQLVKALPKMAKAASSDELRHGFEEHLEQTRGHVERLEKVFKTLGESPKGKTCKAMQGLIEEGAEVIAEDFEGSLMDAALIGAAQRVEHYEIAAYGTVCAFAKELGESDQAELLSETLEEEKETDEKLTELAEQINKKANEGEGAESGEKKGVFQADKKKSRRVA